MADKDIIKLEETPRSFTLGGVVDWIGARVSSYVNPVGVRQDYTAVRGQPANRLAAVTNGTAIGANGTELPDVKAKADEVFTSEATRISARPYSAICEGLKPDGRAIKVAVGSDTDDAAQLAQEAVSTAGVIQAQCSVKTTLPPKIVSAKADM